MSLETVLLGCFLFGLLFTAGSFFGGHLHLGHVHFGGHHGHGGRGAAAHWFSPFSIAAFLCWFGGVGYLLQRQHAFALVGVLAFALLAGCAGASVISLFLTKVLMRNERPLRPEDTEMRGVLARVSSGVRAGGTGEIVFALNGTRHCSAARSTEPFALAAGTEVVVLNYTRGVAWIAPFHAEAQTPAKPLPGEAA